VSKQRITGSDNITLLWTPRDSIDTASQFHLEMDNAERGVRDDVEIADPVQMRQAFDPQGWLMSQSRFRKAKVYDFLAVLLMLATMAALGCAVFFLSTPQAKADPIDPVAVAYAAHYAGAVCATLDDFPNLNGILGLVSAIQDDGLTAGQAGAAIGLSVAEACPRYEPLLEAFINRYGSVNV